MLRLHLPDRASEALSTEAFVSGVEAVRPLPSAEDIRAAVWIDLAFPLEHERREVEAALSLDLPNKAEMTSIEASSRVYRDGNAQVMNLMLVVGVDSGSPAAVPVSLILTPERLVTVRYSDPIAFRSLDESCVRMSPGSNPRVLLLRLVENIIDRTADILERMGSEIDSQSALIFGRDRPSSARLSTDDLNAILKRIGNTQFVLNKVHDSLVTLSRAANFLQTSQGGHESDSEPRTSGTKAEKQLREDFKSMTRDIASLSENSGYMIQQVSFLLDAAVGRISVEQTAIVKIFSVLSVVFLPPTLVASIYGMNFEHMPELGFRLGYPMSLVMMVLSALGPYLFFKRKGWL